MQALVHKLEAELLPKLKRQCASLQHDQRFARVAVVSDSGPHPPFSGPNSYIWRLDCHSPTDRADWTRLSLQVAMIFAGAEVTLQGMVLWYFARSPGELPPSGREYSTRQIIGVPDVSVTGFLSELPALFKAFDEVVARGRPEVAA